MAPSPDNLNDIQFTAAPPTAPIEDFPTRGLPEKPAASDVDLRKRADAMTRQWEMLAVDENQPALQQRLALLGKRLSHRLRVCESGLCSQGLTPQVELLESTRMLEAVLTTASHTSPAFAALPRVRVAGGVALPRVVNLAEEYLSIAEGIWSPASLATYVHQTQLHSPLQLEEIRMLPQALNLAQLEFILDRADEAFARGPLPSIEQSPFSAGLHSIRRLNQFEWQILLESLVAFDEILRQDPCNVYADMEEETRNRYHTRVAELARYADASEVEIALCALDLARNSSRTPASDPRYARRISHIGFYLFAEGLTLLIERVGYHPPPIERVRSFVRRWDVDFYILGTFTLTVFLIVAVIAPLVPHHAFWPVMGALLLALLPATQGALDLVNGSVSVLFKAEALPKLDFSRAIPAIATTLVVVPTLLLNEKQVHELFEELEARYLCNQDPNLHFGLLTDLPDATAQPPAEEHNPLVQLAMQCTANLNEKYAHERGGSFILLHRRRVFNSRQGVWMGWERKRGKLLDLNKFLLHYFDSFPIKAGPLEVLEHVRYVITLDSDTQLPRSTAARLVGTIAHPLNQAIVNPRLRVVTAGYGILQPRVGVSVASASRSRLAALYSGETGFDIYTRAVSDVYQDLFGEGIFTGKGIYEVSIFHQVLDRRFPRNALLSHDLIEGSYARAGLVTDIEVIDDYPSHYSAHMRRKHRWVRGDWQIARWLFSQVPDESGRLVPNPISTISRWKIFDNLRRSLAEPVTFLVLLLGWFVLPGGALYWTVATIVILTLPPLVQLVFNLSRAILKLSVVAAHDSFTTFASSFGFAILSLTFLPHHMFLALDAIYRSLIRTLVSGKLLLQWETAAQAESGGGSRNALDRYLLLSPVVALVTAIGLLFNHNSSVLAAAPVLLLWIVAPLVVIWLNAPPQKEEGTLPSADTAFLQQQALHIWRYFLEFGGEQNHWLIPDNVEEINTHQVLKLSPTNLGMLFNARQAAYEFGFQTLPEFARATLGTLATYDKLEKYRGHIYNWYDMETLQAIPPFTISTVDSGNLAAGLYTLHAGACDLLTRPLLSSNTFAALDLTSPPKTRFQPVTVGGDDETATIRAHVRTLHEPPATPTARTKSNPAVVASGTDEWLAGEATRRHAALAQFVERYTPWLLPKFEPLLTQSGLQSLEDQRLPPLNSASEYAARLFERLTTAASDMAPESILAPLANELQAQLIGARQLLSELRSDILTVADHAQVHADAMDYKFLLAESRQLLSIGFDGVSGELHPACYDLLASEARIATFLAVAKGDIPQQAWFRLDRTHVMVNGRAALLSWTGTMFEYMMPSLWMRNFPNTLISQSLESAAQIQRRHLRGIPWGISESGFAQTDELGRYRYQAWGIPALALKYGAEDGPVISPYSTFLTLPLLRRAAIANLRRMAALGWVGAYGFYEAADYTQGAQPQLVRSWMAHHQGMSLLALTNLFYDNIAQRWFHANPRIRAAELLLHERPLSNETLKSLKARAKAHESETANTRENKGARRIAAPAH